MERRAIDLLPHPEGGRFREVYRSPKNVQPMDGDTRSALTHIYFQLRTGEVSRFHRVTHDEVWNLYQGSNLRLWIMDPETHSIERIDLSPATQTFCAVVPAGFWQAAEALENDVLVGCSVAPGFDFEDFELITSDHPEAEIFRKHQLDHLV